MQCQHDAHADRHPPVFPVYLAILKNGRKANTAEGEVAILAWLRHSPFANEAKPCCMQFG